MTTQAERVTVSLAGGRSYAVVVGPGVLGDIGSEMRGPFPTASSSYLVLDDFFRGRILPFTESLARAGFRGGSAAFPGGEGCKSWATLGEIVRALVLLRGEAGEPVIALGGGTLGDAVGLAAGLYRRGVPLVQCPTTLLAMVDAAVGGKTAVNIDIGSPPRTHLCKNAAGLFYQPRLVLCDVSVLGTLPPRHLRAGLAECIKHGMIARSVPRPDPALAQWTRANLPAVLAGEHAALVELITRNVRLKAGVVEADEFETADDITGGRALLNLGHTFAHAIETLPGLTLEDGTKGPLLHGEAVGLGLIAASVTARQLGLSDLTDQVSSALRAAGLPARVSGLPDAATLLERMAQDKKTAGGKLRLILPTGEGTAQVVPDPEPRAVTAGINAIRQ